MRKKQKLLMRCHLVYEIESDDELNIIQMFYTTINSSILL